MSNNTSNFTVMAGRPPHGASAMEGNFTAKDPTPVLIEGMVVAVEDDTGPVISELTSSISDGSASADYPWLVIQGMDQWDTQVVDNVTCLAMKSGLIFKVDTALSFAVGDLVYANAGIITTLASVEKQAVGQVLEVNDTAGYIVVAT